MTTRLPPNGDALYHKRCTHPGCLTLKLWSQFGVDKGRKDGLTQWCKACSAAHQKAYRVKVRAKIEAYDKAMAVLAKKRAAAQTALTRNPTGDPT